MDCAIEVDVTYDILKLVLWRQLPPLSEKLHILKERYKEILAQGLYIRSNFSKHQCSCIEVSPDPAGFSVRIADCCAGQET